MEAKPPKCSQKNERPPRQTVALSLKICHRVPTGTSVAAFRVSREGAMRAYSLDDQWDRLTLRYDERGLRVPQRWLWLYRVIAALFPWGAQ